MFGQQVIARARHVLQDLNGTRWADSEFTTWINDGCVFIAINRPDSCVVNASMVLFAGTKQSIAALPIPGMRLLDVVRELTTGRGVKLTDRNTLDTHRPGWHAATPAPVVNYVYDNRDPTTFYVYPPADPGSTLEILYQRVPVAISVEQLDTHALSPADLYLPALVDYVLFRAYSKDADDTKNADLAGMYLTACANGLGIKSRADLAASPDMNSAGGTPAAGGA